MIAKLYQNGSERAGWGGWIRTTECRLQRPMPYHLATPQYDTGMLSEPAARVIPALTRNQIRGFWAAWAGWTFDGMDSFIYALVLVPALSELLPRSGIEATAVNVGFYGSVLFALFLVGWGLSTLWGPLADRFGRVRTLV